MALFIADIDARCRGLAEALEDPAGSVPLLRDLDTEVMVEQGQLSITLSAAALARQLDPTSNRIADDERIALSVPASLRRRGHELRLVQASVARPAEPDQRLIQLLAAGRAAWRDLQQCRPAGAARRSHLARMARLAFLAPDIVMAIVDGRQPVDLTSRALLRISDLPMVWDEQRRVLGFG
jgi:site-specific DNA recombinase